MEKEKPKKILDRLQTTIDKFTENAGVPPYALVCNKKTYDAIALEMYQGLRWERTRPFEEPPKKRPWPATMTFKEIPIIKNNDAPGNMIYAVDKEAHEEIMDIAKPTSSGDKV